MASKIATPKKWIHLSFTPIGDDGSVIERRIEFESQEEMNKFIEAEKKDNKSLVHVEQKQGQETTNVQDYAKQQERKNPGQEQVRTSLDTFDVSPTRLQTEINTWLVVLDPAYVDLTMFLDRVRAVWNGTGAVDFKKCAAMLWLNDQMTKMHVRTKVRDRIVSKAKDKMDTSISMDSFWSMILQWHNGFIKKAWEAVTFGPALIHQEQQQATKKKKRKRNQDR